MKKFIKYKGFLPPRYVDEKISKNKKNNKEKTLALVLAGGLVTSTLNVVNTSADMIQDVNLVESVSTSNESVIPNQTLNFDKSKPSDITITGIKFNSKDLKSISITNEKGEPINFKLNEINVDKDSATITIPSNVVSNLNLTVGVHAISLHFSDDSATIGAVSVNVIDSNSAVNPPKDDNTIVVPPVTPPSDDTVTPPSIDKENTIVIDKNNLKNIEIPNFIPVGSKVKFVTINGKKLPVKYMNIRTASNEEITPAVYVYGDKLVIPVEVLKYVGIDVDKYDIEATLEDGTTVSKSIQLEVINSSNKEDDKITENPSDNNQITNKPSNKPSNNEIANGNANKNDSTKLENSSNNKLPNTGAAVSSGLIGSLSTLIGAVLLRKKK